MQVSMRPVMKGEGHISAALDDLEKQHVDIFIDDHTKDAYARWMLDHFRRSAAQRIDFDQFMRDRKLFCDYEGNRYHVTGASTLGDIWLVRDFKRDYGYDFRVLVADCSAWGPQP
jgi:hypothetical protein